MDRHRRRRSSSAPPRVPWRAIGHSTTRHAALGTIEYRGWNRARLEHTRITNHAHTIHDAGIEILITETLRCYPTTSL